MSDAITPDDVLHVATLAKLRIDADEVDRYTRQLGAILDHAKDMEELELDDVAPTAHPLPLVNVLRADIESATLDRDEVLASAPAAESDRFRVPAILGEEP